MLESMRALIITLTLAALAIPAHADNPSLKPRQQTVVIKHKDIGDKPIIGPRYAPVTVDFFIRLNDTYYTKNIYYRIKQLAKRHPTRMRVVFRPMPHSIYSYWYFAEAGLEAYDQGKFFEFVEALYKRRRRPNQKQLSEVAEAVGMDVERFEKALATRRHRAAWEANFNYYMQRLNVRTPQEPLLFNGKRPVSNNRRGRYSYRRRSYYMYRWDSKYMSVDQLENSYDEAYTRGRTLLARGVPMAKLYDALIAEVDNNKPPLKILKRNIDNAPRNWLRKKTATRPLKGKIDLSGPHTRGPQKAPVTVAFFCSLNGQYCRNMKMQVIDHLTKTYPNRVRIVFKHLFDDTYRGTRSYYRRRWKGPRMLHEASMCAHEQGAFWRYIDMIYRRYGYTYRYRIAKKPDFENFAKQLQLDTDKFVKCATSRKYKTYIDKKVKEARQANVVHTPSIIIGGRLYEGTKTPHEVLYLIRQELAPGWLRSRWPSKGEDLEP